ncbi:FecR family protein [Larkinella soli]|uniref:FecR family protein n=1 Tax=Larkinella soli TaxID=1770527 RepID=UPI000FFC238E|nr:FecR domain-containing protein [Larkinella soli]
MADQPENRIDDNLLGKFLAGETDTAESERVRHWLSQGETEQQEFGRFEKIWETAGEVAQKAPVDTDAAWMKMKSRMQPASAAPGRTEAAVKPLPTVPRRNEWTMVWRVAAAVVLLSGLMWFFLKETETKPAEQLAVAGTTGKIEKILPDGTRVLLNKNSRLTYPESFAADRREVTLTGEAFFEVTPDAARPFRIRARNTTVQVLGTSFSVQAYNADVKVAVRTGKVKFSARDKAVTLEKNEQAAFLAKSDTILKAPRVDTNIWSFKTGRLEFDNEPLREVIQTINQVYHADVRLGNNRLGNCPIDVVFDEKDSLDYVIQITAETMNLKTRREGSRWILDGTACQ